MKPIKTSPQSNLVPIGKILKKITAPRKPEMKRWVLSGAASARLQTLSNLTGIDQAVLSDAAIRALFIALRGKPDAVAIRDKRLRDWLNRPDVES